MRAPIIGAALYRSVMEAAGWVCQCSGECGSTHRRGGLCRVPNTSRARLVAAPPVPLPDREAVTADASGLRAYCPNCWQRLRTAAAETRAEAAADAQESLF